MDAYKHFKLNKPPFELRPDADFYFDVPSHAEVLATLQYSVHAGKGCCVVVGESGCGKTLLAQMVAADVIKTTPILWVHGGGQPSDQTNASVYRWPSQKRERGEAALQTTLAAETHTAAPRPEPPLLIVDCADELPAQGWADVIAWLTNEAGHPKPPNVLLFGLPRLLDLLASPALVRLQGRVFRACQLEPLTEELSQDYIRTRIANAGGDAPQIFSNEIIERISRVGEGNPALINQLCDNALLEAFGEGRSRVTDADVANALHVMLMGRLSERAALPPVQGRSPWHATAMMPEAAPLPEQPIAPAQVVEITDSVDTRLRQFTERLSRILTAIHEVTDTAGEGLCPSPAGGLRTITAETTAV
jgi:type II secretory pathway predicted ATPase ExeA